MSAFLESLEKYRIGSLSVQALLSAVVVFVLCYLFIRLMCALADRFMRRSKLDPGLYGFFRSIVKGVLWFVAIIFVAAELGIDTASLVALLSVAGLALSLSVQGTLGNLFSGLTLLTIKPFTVGDYVEIGGISGTVNSVGMFYTSLVTLDLKRVYVPNSDVTAAKLVNYSAEPQRRIELTISASYSDPTEQVKKALLSAAASVPRVAAEPAPFASVSNYGDNAIEYVLWAWCDSRDFIPTRYALTEAVRDAFEQHGVTMTYPHLNVHMVP